MSPTRLVPDTFQAPSATVQPVAAPTARKLCGPRTCRRFWVLLALTLLLVLALSPAPWRRLLGRVLRWEAARRGAELTIGRIQGGPFDTFSLYDVRCRQTRSTARADAGTDLRVARVDLTPEWFWPGRNRAHRPWLRQVVLDGVSGRYDLGPISAANDPMVRRASPGSWLSRHASRFVPTTFSIRASDLTAARGAYLIRARQLRLDGGRGKTGFLLAREMEISGPGFQNTFLNRHGRTVWQDNRLTVTGLELAPGVSLSTMMVDGAHLGRRRLDWDATLAALGGEVRAQGVVNLSRLHLGLEIAGTLRALPVQSLARLLGLVGAVGGQIEQGNFSFHGDPEDWPSADMWLSLQATDFRWNRRRWQSLELQTVVLHRRVQVNRLELRQSRNQLSFQGEFPLPAGTISGQPAWTGRWWEAGFSCVVDARLDDLHALSMLMGPRFPEVNGRMSVNGTLETMPGHSGINGYLNVEGSRLAIRGAPLDSLRSTLVFNGETVQVADLQATHGNDHLNGKWTTHLTGTGSYEGELKLSVQDRSVYAPALAGIVNLDKLGLDAAEPRAPILLDGTFHGPGPQGEIVFQSPGEDTEPVRVPAPTVGDWWRDD